MLTQNHQARERARDNVERCPIATKLVDDLIASVQSIDPTYRLTGGYYLKTVERAEWWLSPDGGKRTVGDIVALRDWLRDRCPNRVVSERANSVFYLLKELGTALRLFDSSEDGRALRASRQPRMRLVTDRNPSPADQAVIDARNQLTEITDPAEREAFIESNPALKANIAAAEYARDLIRKTFHLPERVTETAERRGRRGQAGRKERTA